jgi:hypothetical protein
LETECSTLPTVSDKLNVMASIHNRKLIAILTKGLKERDHEIAELKQQVSSLEDKINDLTERDINIEISEKK